MEKDFEEAFLRLFPYIKGSKYIEGLVMIEKEQLNNVNHIQNLTKDLVRLSILANNIIIQGQFKGSIADEVNQVLALCKAIQEEYVCEEE